MQTGTKDGKTIRFHRGIYVFKAIRDTMEAYKELADFEMVKDKEYYTVTVKEIFDEGAKDTVLHEFGNYALHQTIAEQKKWQ